MLIVFRYHIKKSGLNRKIMVKNCFSSKPKAFLKIFSNHFWSVAKEVINDDLKLCFFIVYLKNSTSPDHWEMINKEANMFISLIRIISYVSQNLLMGFTSIFHIAIFFDSSVHRHSPKHNLRLKFIHISNLCFIFV